MKMIESTFKRNSGKGFPGLMIAAKSEVGGKKRIHVRITDISLLKAEGNKTDHPFDEQGRRERQEKNIFDESNIAMAFVGINYKFSRVIAAFCAVTAYTEKELQ